MGRSIGVPDTEPEGVYKHELSGSQIEVKRRKQALFHKITEAGQTAEYQILYAIGAKSVGRTYLVRAGPFLLESPFSYYTGHGWEPTPGYQQARVLDFDTVVSSSCLFCHAGKVFLTDHSDHCFADPPFESINCERCHGSATEHMKRPVRGTIINPIRLPERARDSVCEQCHLEGEARLLNPGRDWWDFRPGQHWEHTAAVYMERDAKGFRALSQVEQLAQSRCIQAAGGKLWCGSCHDPHSQSTSETQVRHLCQSCHSRLAHLHAKDAQACTACHMSRLSARNIAHAAITDHRLGMESRLRPEEAPSRRELVAWREPPATWSKRDLGLAYVKVGEAERAADFATEGFRLLYELPEDLKEDVAVLAGLGSLYLRVDRPGEALSLFRSANRLKPDNAEIAMMCGLARYAAGDYEGAEKDLVLLCYKPLMGRRIATGAVS